MKTKKSLLCLSVAALMAGMTAFAAVPEEINYQGRLTTIDGTPVNGTVQIKLEMYDSPEGSTTPLYKEDIGTVDVINGVYSFTFGANGTEKVRSNELVISTNGINQIFNGTLKGNPIDGTVEISDGFYSWTQDNGSSSSDFSVTYFSGSKAVQVIYLNGIPSAGRQIQANYQTIAVTTIYEKMTANEHYLGLIIDGMYQTSTIRLLAVPFALRSRQSSDAIYLNQRFNELVSELQARRLIPAADLATVWGGSLPNLSGLGQLDVNTFHIGKHEVTWLDWLGVRAWANANGYDLAGVGVGCHVSVPVTMVNWFDALKWCNARSEMEGLTPCYTVSTAVYRTGQQTPTFNAQANGYRLPTEKEWEFAARGGAKSQYYTYSGGEDINSVGWTYNTSLGAACDLDGGRGVWFVMQKQPNEINLYDMSGNVSEWCWDRSSTDAPIRGGNWSVNPFFCTLEIRTNTAATNRLNTVGFRIAQNFPQ